MKRLLGSRRRGGRRKGEERFRFFDRKELNQIFECGTVDELRAKLESLGIHYHFAPEAFFLVKDLDLPEDWRERADELIPDLPWPLSRRDEYPRPE
jgi:hypothetical protein